MAPLATSCPTGVLTVDPAGGEERPLHPDEVGELETVLALAGLSEVSLADRYSAVFVYPGMGVGEMHPDLAGCTTEVCTFIEEAQTFLRHGIQVIGLSAEPSPPPDGCPFPFPVGLLPYEVLGGLIQAVEKAGRRYAIRASYVIFPDGSGVRISKIHDVVRHVRHCFEVAMARRLESYRRDALEFLARNPHSLPSQAELRDLLANGSDSVVIPRVDLRFELVSKVAHPRIVAEEAGYIERINRLLAEQGCPLLFPPVISICLTENPGWYLMGAANPLTLDRVLFEDPARTRLSPDRMPLMNDALLRLMNLYQLTFRPETPKVARYHYLERFGVIPARQDTRETFRLLFGGQATLDDMLTSPFVLDDEVVCRPYLEQVGFLESHLDRLLQPVGAYLHGDVHLPNMLLALDGRTVVFIDPRIVWDGNDVGDPGFGDPLYDLGTLLHSLHPMSAILHAIAEGRTEELLQSRLPGHAGEPVEVRSEIVPLNEHPTLEWFPGWVRDSLPSELLGEHWEARLHVNTANALLGWLKHARSVQTRHAWLAIFSAVLFHLEMGRRRLEGGTP